ncbi:MAG: PGPGW domain-containing protein [Mariprofundaceae bacterium]
MQILIDYFHEYAAWVVAISLLSFVIGIIMIPILVARIPVDYFSQHKRHRMANSSHHPLFRLILACLKNILGAILLIAGFIMLFTPGQGLLSILFGLMIMNYPGKYRLECWIINRPLIFNTINTLRQKQGQPPLSPPEADYEKQDLEL